MGYSSYDHEISTLAFLLLFLLLISSRYTRVSSLISREARLPAHRIPNLSLRVLDLHDFPLSLPRNLSSDGATQLVCSHRGGGGFSRVPAMLISDSVTTTIQPSNARRRTRSKRRKIPEQPEFDSLNACGWLDRPHGGLVSE
jgi:hypothetical protein